MEKKHEFFLWSHWRLYEIKIFSSSKRTMCTYPEITPNTDNGQQLWVWRVVKPDNPETCTVVIKSLQETGSRRFETIIHPVHFKITNINVLIRVYNPQRDGWVCKLKRFVLGQIYICTWILGEVVRFTTTGPNYLVPKLI